jgi:subtilase family serine protease
MIDDDKALRTYRRFNVRAAYRGLTGAACIAALACLFVSTPSQAQQRPLLTHHVRAAVVNGQAHPVGPLPMERHLQLSISLPLRNQAALKAFLKDLYDPKSPSYRKYLTVKQFTDRFGPTPGDYAAVIRFAKANGMAVTETSPNRVLINVDASVAEINKTFHVTMGIYQHPTEPRTFYAPDREPSVDLAIPLWHITGLDDFSPPPDGNSKRWPRARGRAVTFSAAI